MSKKKKITNPALLKKDKSSPVNYNLAPAANSFNAIFDPHPLEEREAGVIDQLLMEGHDPEVTSEDDMGKDMLAIRHITSEIKAVGKQAAVLIGERLARVRDVLKCYRADTFTRYLEAVFGSRRTGHNLLAYYQLYNALPDDSIRRTFQGMPQKAAYMLASRTADLQAKAEIIRESDGCTAKEIALIIQQRLPTLASDRRSNRRIMGAVVESMANLVRELSTHKERLTSRDYNELALVRELLDSLLANANLTGSKL
ncbi:MAG: CT583 family protein [Candidatus Obscuribacterales bacterium]